jgi:heme-degrading monooxygenase HmoA
MILEIADFRIAPDQHAAFEAAIRKGVDEFLSQADGFIGCQVQQSIETPERYVLTVQWETLEAHNVGFRNSPLFTSWRACVGSFYVAPPVVENFKRCFEA